MAGIGIRYLELARRLPGYGVEVVLVHAGPLTELPDLGNCQLLPYSPRLHLPRDCAAAVVQGELADAWLARSDFRLPVAVDLYDPWLVENFAYYARLGLTPWQRDLASWKLQMTRGDFFLCSCEEQRLFYLGFLTALGRVRPDGADADFRNLIDCVPFGVPLELEPFRPVWELEPGCRHWLFGGIYDWYDPLTLLEALVPLEDQAWQLHFMRNPNPGSTPQQLLERVEARCRQLGWWQSRVRLHDWVDVSRRFDLFRQFDALVCPHQPDLESRLSLRTRILEAMSAGLPVVVSKGGGLSSRMTAAGAGWQVPPGEVEALTEVLRLLLLGGPEVARRSEAGQCLASEFAWDQTLKPLLRFLANPARSGRRRRGWFG